MLKQILLSAKHLLSSIRNSDLLHQRGKPHRHQSPTFFDGAGPSGMAPPPAGTISAHATNQAHSKGEGEADTTSNRQAASSASWVQTPTQQINMPNKSENNYRSFSCTHVHSRKHKKFSNIVKGPDSGLMDPPSGGRLPDRFLISTSSRYLMSNI